MKLLVLGIGNTILTDEGVGIFAMRALEKQFAGRADIEFIDGGTLSFTLAVPISECDALLVIDAAELGKAPGSIQCFEGEEMDSFMGANRKSSVHEVGLLDLMSISLLTGHWPQQRALIGVQPSVVGWGEMLTPDVEAALPELIKITTGIVERFTRPTP